VAGASLAQAHDATLADGRRVAVKVLRPGIERRVARDAEVLALAARLVERWSVPARRLEPRGFATTVIRATQLELDLRLEAAGADELGEVMGHDGYMRAPKVVWDGVGKRVLTLEWAEGEPLSDPAALALPGLDHKLLADNLIRAFLAQALDHGVFHADLHEGNLFVAAPARLMAVDFGIIGRLGAPERRYLAEILWGFLERDYERVARVHFEAGYVPERHSVAAFAQALRAVGEPLFGRAASAVSMSRVLTQLFEITGLYDMRLRPELVLLQKTMMTVEGVARRIDPDHDIWAAADPVVRRWMLRELSPATRVKRLAEDAAQALRNLARMTQPAEPVPVVAETREGAPLLWFALGALASGAAFLAAALLR
jgi:ubiquinone biosynthesis protein